MKQFFSSFKNIFRRHSAASANIGGAVRVRAEEPKEALLFADSVHERLFRERPYGSSASALAKLSRHLNLVLARGPQQADGNYATRLPGIKRLAQPDQRGEFSLTVRDPGHDQPIIRTQGEIELHILLQSHLRQFDPALAKTGDSIGLDSTLKAIHSMPGSDGLANQGRQKIPAISANSKRPLTPQNMDGSGARRQESTRKPFANLTGSLPKNTATAVTKLSTPPTAPVATARTAGQASPSHLKFRPPESNANCYKESLKEDTYYSTTVDMNEIDMRLHGQSHEMKEIAGANSDCWWRAGWAAAIMQHGSDPAEFAQLLIDKLGAEHADKVRDVRTMVESFRDEGIHAIFTGFALANQTHDMQNTPSRLRLNTRDAADGDGAIGEGLCRDLTKLIFAKAGLDESCYLEAVDQNKTGDFSLIAVLLSELDADAVVFGRPWKQAGSTHAPVPNFESSVVQICARPDIPRTNKWRSNSRLRHLQFNGDKASCTKALLNETDCIPWIVHQGTHFNLSIPTVLIKTEFATV